MSAWESFWRSVRRNLRLLIRALAGPNARIADEALSIAGKANKRAELAVGLVDRIQAERDELESECREYAAGEVALLIRQGELEAGVRLALMSAGYLHPSDDLVADVRRMADEYVQTVAQLRLLKEQSATDRRNCVDMSDRLAAVHREKDDLERRVFELEGRAAEPTVITGEGLSTWTPR